MVGRGISLYPGLGCPAEAGLAYLELARRAGFSRLFTSLHIPEADGGQLLAEFRRMVGQAAALGLAVTADISPRAFPALGAARGDLAALRRLGVAAVRLDFGFSEDEIAAWARHGDLPVVLNASTIDEAALERLLAAGVAPGAVEACHNYYPRPESGLSHALFAQRSRAFRRHGIPVSAFVPAHRAPRGPLHEGLPTLEAHRHRSALQAAKELIWGGEVDHVLVGDPLADPAEIAAIGALQEDCIELQVTLSRPLEGAERALLFAAHVNRTDPPAGAIRAAAVTDGTAEVPAAGGQPRPRGSVTIDNRLYRRYAGNLQIQQQDLPADARVNVVARVIPEEVFLLDLIGPGRKFRLVEAR